MCGDSNNAFFELSAVQHNLLLTDTILIGGQRRSVKKIMAYKRQWVLNFWVDPVRQLAAQARLRSMLPSPTPAIEDRPYDYNTFNNSHYSNSRSSDNGCCCCNII